MDLESLMNGHMEPSKEVNSAQKKNDVAHGNPYLDDAELGLKLCSDLIAKPNKNSPADQLVDEIGVIIGTDFLSHTEDDDNRAGAKTYAQLLQWHNLLAEVMAFPQLQQSYTVAVGGSFSAGKTRFLNTVLGCPSLLPVDTTPTTSIPTYLYKGQSNRIDALNFYGKKTEIDEHGLKAICHAFNQKYQVTFSHILQLLAVERVEFKYANLIFLDTPGYSKADNIAATEQNTDENIARLHLRLADYLIWLVDHQNGTVPQPDIEFLQSLDLKQPILVVMSKTDKKPKSEIEKIIEIAKQDLDAAEINYVDVIGYSAAQDSEISVDGERLSEFISQVNTGSQGSTLQWQLNQIFGQYHNHYHSSQQSLKLSYSTINELIFDEMISESKKSHLRDFHKKTKANLDALQAQNSASNTIYNEINQRLVILCQCRGIVLSDRPTAIQISALRKKTPQSEQETFCFDALLQGKQTALADLANLNELDGEVVKANALGLSIQITKAPEIEVMVLKNVITKMAPNADYAKFCVGQRVNVQIINDRRAVVSLVVEI
ncbi:dynamin family protein [Vibrio renipiscarius]|uniref:Dynamin N-terminal domain-containing protein n=1 Tax=Vibrio renipiscarius TaxID=1461322 RepID=A0A0C2K0B9_9VIBR|nr:dynamin family protein [Vibrio renipiscarius]KII75368.1 hypothetical protein OJ16_18955 [Vibrio renipiscarius]KII78820.1 hypothetical protein PL18_11065 [Vibrio renipiscarius]